ncbi:hypothetical protein FACS189468_1480 [Spirochaetia bacterium]|nr:hypothetical protein FACS189468_1480 [Spirochaetia bacterium]
MIPFRHFCLLLLLLPLMLQAQESPVSATEGFPKIQPEETRRLEVIRRLRDRGIPFEERPLLAEYGGFGSSILVRFPPAGEAEPVIPGEETIQAGTFILGIPLTGTGDIRGRPGDFSFGLEAGLAFIDRLFDHDPGAPQEVPTGKVLVAFLGNEQGVLPGDVSRNTHLGLLDLRDLIGNPENTALLYMDITGPPGGIVLHHGGGDRPEVPSPLAIVMSLPELCKARAIPYRFAVPYNAFIKLGIVEGPEILELLQIKGPPSPAALYISGGGPGPDDTGGGTIDPDAFAALLTDYIASLKLDPENPDYHYSFIDLGDTTRFIPETLAISFLVSIAVLGLFAFLVYSIVFRRHFIIHWRNFVKYFWVLAVSFIFLALSMLGAEWLIKLFLEASSPLGNSRITMAGLGSSLALTLILYSFTVPLFYHLKIPRADIFYGNAGSVLVILEVLIAIFIDISFVPPFLWVFLFIFLGGLIKNTWIIWVCALLAPVQTVAALIRAVSSGVILPAEWFLDRTIPVALVSAAFLVPMVLILRRGALLSRWEGSGFFARPRWIPKGILLVLSLGALFGYGLLAPGPQAPGPERRIITEHAAGDSAPLDISLEIRTFLERQILTIALTGRGSPARFDLFLKSSQEEDLPVIYDAPMPFLQEEDGVRLSLGEGPPNPFTTEIVLPLAFSGSLRAEALYAAWDPSVDPGPRPESSDYVLRVIKTIPVASEE